MLGIENITRENRVLSEVDKLQKKVIVNLYVI